MNTETWGDRGASAAPVTPHARPTWLAIAVIGIAAAAGYVVTCAIYPAPILVRQVAVPALRGLLADTAMARLGRLGFKARVTDSVGDPQLPSGAIAWQSPAPETVLPEGAAVRLGVSTGAPLVAVPDLADLDFELSRQVLAAAGLRIGSIDSVQNSADLGTVLSTRPAAGASLPTGAAVDLNISQGPDPVTVPNLVGQPLAEVRDRLAALGLRLGTLEMQTQGKDGTVLGQQPAAGERVKRETAVDLMVSGNQP